MSASKLSPPALSIIFRLTTYKNVAYLSEDYKNLSLNSLIRRFPDVPLHWDKLHSG